MCNRFKQASENKKILHEALETFRELCNTFEENEVKLITYDEPFYMTKNIDRETIINNYSLLKWIRNANIMLVNNDIAIDLSGHNFRLRKMLIDNIWLDVKSSDDHKVLFEKYCYPNILITTKEEMLTILDINHLILPVSFLELKICEDKIFAKIVE